MHQVALVLAVVVVGDDDDLAAREGFDGFGRRCSSWVVDVIVERSVMLGNGHCGSLAAPAPR